MRVAVLLLPGTLVLLAAPRPAGATYTIAGADTATKQVGGAGVSCPTSGMGGMSLYEVVQAVRAGVAVGHALGSPNAQARNRGLNLIVSGSSPEEAITQITKGDTSVNTRIYGFADTQGRSAGYFGTALSPGGEKQGNVGTFTYSVQGGYITSGVLANASAGFGGSGCDLAARLMQALEGGAKNNGGDQRCTSQFSTPGETAFLVVVGADGKEVIKIVIPGLEQPNDPIKKVRQQYDTWRATHPCSNPAVLDAGGLKADGGEPSGDDGSARIDGSSGMRFDSGKPATRQDGGKSGPYTTGCACGMASSSDGVPAAAAAVGLALALVLATRRRRSRRL